MGRATGSFARGGLRRLSGNVLKETGIVVPKSNRMMWVDRKKTCCNSHPGVCRSRDSALFSSCQAIVNSIRQAESFESSGTMVLQFRFPCGWRRRHCGGQGPFILSAFVLPGHSETCVILFLHVTLRRWRLGSYFIPLSRRLQGFPCIRPRCRSLLGAVVIERRHILGGSFEDCQVFCRRAQQRDGQIVYAAWVHTSCVDRGL